jgi:enoyl-CoA hydratase/carnithine racemase
VARRAGVKGTRGSILEEATRLFGAQGYTGTTMRQPPPGQMLAYSSAHQKLEAEQALDYGAIDEVVPRRDVLPRALAALSL